MRVVYGRSKGTWEGLKDNVCFVFICQLIYSVVCWCSVLSKGYRATIAQPLEQLIRRALGAHHNLSDSIAPTASELKMQIRVSMLKSQWRSQFG